MSLYTQYVTGMQATTPTIDPRLMEHVDCPVPVTQNEEPAAAPVADGTTISPNVVSNGTN